MIKKIRRYYMNEKYGGETPSYLREWFRVEVLIDNSLNIFLVNQYYRVNKVWKLIKTEAYMNEKLVLEKVKELDTYYKKQYAQLLNRTVDTYKTQRLDEREQRTEVFYTVRHYAHELLVEQEYKRQYDESKNKEAFIEENKEWKERNNVFKDYSIRRVAELKEEKVLPPSFDIEKEARKYIKTTGLVVYADANGGATYYKNSKEYQERISNKFYYPRINDPDASWCENEYRD